MGRVNKVVNRYELDDLSIILNELLELMEKVMPGDEYRAREQDAILLKEKLLSIKEDTETPLSIFLEDTLMEKLEVLKERLKERQNEEGIIETIKGVEFESLNSIIPSKYIIPNNKLSNAMTKGEIEKYESVDLTINSEKRKEIVTKVSLIKTKDLLPMIEVSIMLFVVYMKLEILTLHQSKYIDV